MTLAEIVEEIYEGLGNPSDLEYLDPDDGTVDTASAGWLKMVRAVNEGQLALATWKLANGRQVKLRLNEDVAVVVTASDTVTVSAVDERNLTLSATTDEGSLIVGRTSLAVGIAAYVDDNDVVLVRQTGTFLVGETADVYHRDYLFPTTTLTKKPIDVLQVMDSSGAVLEMTSSDEPLMAVGTTLGTPTKWKRINKGIKFDAFPNDDLEYYIRFVRGPKTLTATTDEPELPPQLHRGLVLYGMWWGLRRMQESSDAYSVKRDLDDFMARTRIEDDFIVSGQVKIYPEGH